MKYERASGRNPPTGEYDRDGDERRAELAGVVENTDQHPGTGHYHLFCATALKISSGQYGVRSGRWFPHVDVSCQALEYTAEDTNRRSTILYRLPDDTGGSRPINKTIRRAEKSCSKMLDVVASLKPDAEEERETLAILGEDIF